MLRITPVLRFPEANKQHMKCKGYGDTRESQEDNQGVAPELLALVVKTSSGSRSDCIWDIETRLSLQLIECTLRTWEMTVGALDVMQLNG